MEIVTRPAVAYAAAARIVAAALAEAERRGLTVAAAVCDPQGVLLAFGRHDAAPGPVGDYAIDKAWTAATLGKSTAEFGARMTSEPALTAGLANRPRALAWEGGVPIRADGAVIGGVGVSGATGPDDGACADAGLRAAEDRQPKGGPTMATTETYPSEPNGMIPNSRYPLLIHRGGVPGGGEDAVRARFRANGWLNNWRYPGIYDYGHFHSTTHECLGVAIGWMELELFGEGGTRARLEAGDVVVMPAGVSHAMVGGSEDVLVVGGYPDGRDWDNIKDHLLDEPMRRAAAKRIMMLPIPAADPVTGKPMREWLDAPSSVDAGLNDFREGLDPL